MDFNKAQEDLNQRFSYTKDKGESWTILKGDGQVKGDCEDYSLTLAWLTEDKSYLKLFWAFLTFKYIIWFCKVSGNGHAIMYIRGKGWTDNISKKVMKDLPDYYKLKYPMLLPHLYLKLILT